MALKSMLTKTRLAQTPHAYTRSHTFIFCSFIFIISDRPDRQRDRAPDTAGAALAESLTKINNKLKTAGYLHCTRLPLYVCVCVCECV